VAADKKSSRDSHGRWAKGVSGNPKGRPHKYANFDHGDFLRFKNTILEVNTPDGRRVMTREAAIQHRLYQSAMQGNVHAQIFLARRFDKYAEEMSKIVAKFHDLVFLLKEEKRGPTEAETSILNAAQVAMGDRPRPKDTFQRTGKPRSRRTPKRKDGSSDPNVKS
jgi:Family of unknown function (DUF5681)